MKVIATALDGVYIIKPQIFEDQRGFFMESYNKKIYKENGLDPCFIQDNHSYSAAAGTIRGLHYQIDPHAQTKLIRVIFGAIYDVVVDIRKSSPTFGQWLAVTLSAENKRQLFIPKGFAHGFCTLTDDVEVVYKVDQHYSAENDRGIIWNDSEIGIEWPVANPILSKKDQCHPLLCEAEIFK